MTQPNANSSTAKLENAAQRIIAYGAGRLNTIHLAHSHPEYHSDHDAGPLNILRAVIDFQQERILAFIDPDGALILNQNWGEVGQATKPSLALHPSAESRAAYRKIASQLNGKIPHPPVTWTISTGPWCVARMNHKVIVEAGAARNIHPIAITFPNGRTIHDFQEAERLMDDVYYPQYPPISLEPARRQLR